MCLVPDHSNVPYHSNAPSDWTMNWCHTVNTKECLHKIIIFWQQFHAHLRRARSAKAIDSNVPKLVRGEGVQAKITISVVPQQIFIWKALSQKRKVGRGKSIHFLKALLKTYSKINRDLKQTDAAAERRRSTSKFLFRRTRGQVNSVGPWHQSLLNWMEIWVWPPPLGHRVSLLKVPNVWWMLLSG